MLTAIAVLLAIAAVLLLVKIVRPPFPLWPAVAFLMVIELVRILPIGK